MRCNQNHSTIEAYFDGELEDDARKKIARHIDECAACAAVLQELRIEEDVYIGYEPQVEIKPELWAMVQSRIVEERPARAARSFNRLSQWFRSTFVLPRVSGWATAALILVAIGLTVIVMRSVRPGQERVQGPLNPPSTTTTLPAPPQKLLPEQTTAAAQTEEARVNPVVSRDWNATAIRAKAPARSARPAKRPNTPEQLVREAEQKYLVAIAMLTRTVERKRSLLDAATLARLEQSLASVDRAIAGTRKVVRQHPNDPVAVQYMLNAYSRKVDVLREVIGY